MCHLFPLKFPATSTPCQVEASVHTKTNETPGSTCQNTYTRLTTRLTATIKLYALFIIPPLQPMSTWRSQSTSSVNEGRIVLLDYWTDAEQPILMWSCRQETKRDTVEQPFPISIKVRVCFDLMPPCSESGSRLFNEKQLGISTSWSAPPCSLRDFIFLV